MYLYKCGFECFYFAFYLVIVFIVLHLLMCCISYKNVSHTMDDLNFPFEPRCEKTLFVYAAG